MAAPDGPKILYQTLLTTILISDCTRNSNLFGDGINKAFVVEYLLMRDEIKIEKKDCC